MLEIIKILLVFPTFFLFLLFPINTFHKKNYVVGFDLYSLNLMINLNILLLCSLLPIPIHEYQILFLFFYVIMLVYKIYKKNFDNLFFDKHTFFIFFISFIIIATAVAANLEFGWDAKFFYYTKTLFFFEGIDIGEIKNFKNYFWHPHFGSYVWAFFWKLPFISAEYFGRLFYVFIFCFSILNILFSCIKKYNFRLFIFLSTLILIYRYELFSGLQEILIFSLLVVSSKLISDLKLDKNNINIFILLLIMNILLWTKSEGLVFLIILMFILILNNKISLKKKYIIFFVSIVLISFKKIIYVYLNFDHVAQSHYNLDFLLTLNLDEVLSRIKYIFIYLSYYSITNTFFIMGTIILIYLNFKKNKIIDIKNFNYYFLLNLGFIFSAYIFREMEIVYAIRTTLDRIIFTSSGFYLYLVFKFLDQNINNLSNK